ncbi:hypothetical protein CIK94_07595, partial [Prevotella sp. P4-51]|uniref:hypothetical protein n=1 Tax=Prevotella sp. P4-51 TaxID=2024228 RepID=UPI000B96E551
YELSNGISLNWIIVFLMLIANFIANTYTYSFQLRRNELKWFVTITIIGFISAVYNSISTSFYDITLFVNNYIAIMVFFFAYIIFTANCNFKVLVYGLYVVGIAAASICLYQRFMLIFTGTYIQDFFIPGLVVNRDLDTFDFSRASAFFTEPAHLSIYLLPIFYISLKRYNFTLSVLFALGILFSGSTTGLILTAILLIAFMVTRGVAKWKLILLAILFAIGYYFVNQFFSEVLLSNIEKLNNTDMQENRFLGPLAYLGFFDLFQWITGIGLNQLGELLNYHGVHLYTDWGKEVNAAYANAVIYMLISYGLWGLLYFIRYLFRTIKTYKSDIGFIIIALGVLLSDQVLFNRNLLYVLMFLIFSNNIINLNKRENDENTLYNRSTAV